MHCSIHQTLVVLSFLLLFDSQSINSTSVNDKKSEAHNHSSHKVKDQHKHEAGVCKSPHYGENPDTTKKLVALEGKLVEYVHEFISTNSLKENSNICYRYLSKYLKEYDQDTLAIEQDKEKLGLPYANRSDIVVENPIFSLKLVRRIAITLMRDALKECKLSLTYINELFKKERLRLPSSEDATKLYGGIMAITVVYRLNIANEPRDVSFNDTSAQLAFEDYMILANSCLNIDLKHDNNGLLSYYWLNAASIALFHEGDLAESPGKLQLKDGWTRLMQKLGLNTIEELHESVRKKWQSKWRYLDSSHENLCRGESDNIPIDQVPRKLVCFFQYKHLFHYRVEIISVDPPIIYYHRFLTDKEIQFIRNESPVKLVEPVMFTQRDKFESEKEYMAAVANQLFQVAEEKNHEPIVQNLARKVEHATRLFASEKYLSVFEYSLYSPLSHVNDVEQLRGTYTVYDADEKTKSFGTYLMFLTDVRMGGYVIFPDINVYVKPERGSTLFFYNFDAKLRSDERLYHENCPVVFGIKEVANMPLHMPPDEVVEDLFPWRAWR